MVTISLCMIVKNEEDVLERCLSGIRDLVDEVIIVDTGSDDHTKQIALDTADQVFTFQWIDDFSAARNFAFSKAGMDYCMWLDADDVIDEENQLKFLALKESLTTEIDIVMMRYNTAFDENGVPTFWYYRERLIRNHPKYRWQGAVHEAVSPDGTVLYSDVSISHQKVRDGDPDRNLNIYRKMLSDGKVLNGRERYYYARELYYHGRYDEALRELEGFLERADAWVENKIEACILSAKCHKMLEERPAMLRALLKSLEYDAPRAEVCCEIGACFMEEKQYRTAVFWYETAMKCEIDSKKGGFILPECYHYIPAIQLCVCYDKLGLHEKARQYNEMAGIYKPESKAYLHNKAYFENRGQSA